MAMATSTKSPSSNFLYQVLTLPTKNTKLFLPLFTIITLINFASVLFIYFTEQSLNTDIALKAKALINTDPTSPDYPVLIAAIQKDAKELLVEVIVSTAIIFVINSFLRITTFFAATVTYSGELLTLREVLVKTKDNIKGPIITHFCGVFFSYLCILPLILISIFLLFIKKGSYAFVIFCILALLLFLLVFLLLLCLSVVWSLSIVVSVVETGCYGLRAFRRAGNLAKEKKMIGFLIILVSTLLGGALLKISSMILKSNSSSTVFVLLFWFCYAFFGELVGMYMWVAVVVYYYECKKSRGEEGEEEDKVLIGGFTYETVPTKDFHVDEELP